MLPFLLIFTFQGVLYYKDSLVKKAVDIALYEASKKASVEGRFTDEIIEETKEMLVRVKFKEDEIVMTGTQTIMPRKSYIEGSISVPRGNIYLFPSIFGGNADREIVRTTRIMSEYLP